MIELQFDFFLKDLDGKDVDQWHAGKMIANTLAISTEGDAAKQMAWAIALHRKEKVTLDSSDFATLKTFIEQSKLFALCKGQILEFMDDAKIKQKAVKKAE